MNSAAPPTEYRADWPHVLLITVLWLAMAAAVNPVGDFPLNDDWTYALAVKSVLETGYYHFPSPTSANVGPQVYWGALFSWPFGFSFTALRISGLCAGLIGVLALRALLRAWGTSRNTALLGALVLAVNPLYFGLSNTFMTDVPFIALTVLALHCMLRGLQKGSRASMAAGVLIALAAILVRQLGVVLLFAFALAWLFRSGLGLFNACKAIALVWLGICSHLLYQHWLVTTGRVPMLTGHADIAVLLPAAGGLFEMLKFAFNAFIYLGFFTLPFAALFLGADKGRHFKPQKQAWLLVAGAFLLCVGLWWVGKLMPTASNVLIASGMGPLTLFDTYTRPVNKPSIPDWLLFFWAAMTFMSAAAAGGAVYLGARAIRLERAAIRDMRAWRENPAAVLCAVTALAYFMILLLVSGRVFMFDRYLLPLLPLGIALMSPRSAGLFRSPGSLVAVGLIALYAAFSVAATHDYLAWNRARWLALDGLVSQARVPASQIDGGYEFNGWLLNDANYQMKPGKSSWWVADDEYIIAFGPLEGYAEMGRYRFKRWLLGTESVILVLRRKSGSAASAAPALQVPGR